jgi:hypothetical protein
VRTLGYIKLILGLPPETLRIAAQTLEYIQRNAQPVIYPGDAFLTSFGKDDTIEPVIDTISQTPFDQENVEDLKEVVDLEEDEETDEQEDILTMEFNTAISDKERRKMEKAKAKAEKDAEKERNRVDKEVMKARMEKEKTDRKIRAVVAKLRPTETSRSAEP